MAKIKVKARVRGQKPDRSWAAEGEVFEVEEAKFSERWMIKVEEKAKATASQTTSVKADAK